MSKALRRDDPHGGPKPVPQRSAVTRQESFLHAPDTEKQTVAHRDPPQTVRRSSFTLKKPEVVDIKDLEADDIVIAVMGPTGCGKSTFVCAASGRDSSAIGHKLRSFTYEVTPVRFWDRESGRHIVLVDTPSFDATFKPDVEILHMISDWLVSSYTKRRFLSGMLYLHRITDNRVASTALKNLRTFQKLCGGDTLDKVYLTTTMWDGVQASVGEERLEELMTEYWGSMIAQGAQIARCRSDDDSSMQLVRRIVAQETAREALSIQEEMAELRRKLKDTGTAQQLYAELETLVEKQQDLLQRIDEEKNAGSHAEKLRELQTEYNELRLQIQDKLCQTRALKSSWFRHLFARGRE